jgi:hypothetical protein
MDSDSKVKNLEKLIKKLVVPQLNDIFSKHIKCKIIDVECGAKFKDESEEIEFEDAFLDKPDFIVRLIFNTIKSDCEVFGISHEIGNIIENVSKYVFTGDHVIGINFIDTETGEYTCYIANRAKLKSDSEIYKEIRLWYSDVFTFNDDDIDED